MRMGGLLPPYGIQIPTSQGSHTDSNFDFSTRKLAYKGGTTDSRAVMLDLPTCKMRVNQRKMSLDLVAHAHLPHTDMCRG